MKKNKDQIRREKLREDIHDILMDINTRAAIAFGLAMIGFLLAYIAFFK